MLNFHKDQISKSDSFFAKIDYMNLPMRQESNGIKSLPIEEVEENLISKLSESGHPIKDVHMRHFTDRYTLEVTRIRDKGWFNTWVLSSLVYVSIQVYKGLLISRCV